jgi:HTH-type transcriptional regulator/antitoxin HigA
MWSAIPGRDNAHRKLSPRSLVRSLPARAVEPKEVQADEWAEEALIPRAIWGTSAVRHQPTPMSVINLANALQVHPAIVAGKIRHEQRNFRLLSQLVGTGQVRRHFGLAA